MGELERADRWAQRVHNPQSTECTNAPNRDRKTQTRGRARVLARSAYDLSGSCTTLPQVLLVDTSSRHRQGRRSRPTMPSHAPPCKRLNALGLVENGPGVQKKSYLRVVSARAPVGSVRPSVRRSQCIASCGRCCTGGHSKLGDACRYQGCLTRDRSRLAAADERARARFGEK